jgi:glycosyltransferase involved in cell wall biosynthesis
MKRILIITYYWPPSGGGGVMRWLKFAKYLPSAGWQPVIFTPQNPDPSVTDESLAREIPPEVLILKLPIWEPYDAYRKLTGKKKGEKFKAGYIAEASSKGWKDKLSVFIRGNLMIPDPRKFWVRPAIKFLTRYLQENPVDLIVSTGPPHSMHLIGLELRKKFSIPWLADFRDPWTNIDFYNRLRLTPWADRRHKSLEKKVLQAADLVSTVSWSWADDFKRIVPRDIEIITNGFDPEDFPRNAPVTDPFFSITHIGSFNKDRNPEAFWHALRNKALSDDGFRKNLRLRFLGQTDQSIFHSLEINNLKDCAEDFGFVDHKKSLAMLGQSQVLLLPLNDAPNVSGIIPGKLFEYLASNRPIIVIGPGDGDTARIIRETGAGKVAGFGDMAGLIRIIDEYYELYLSHKLTIQNMEIKKYSRQELTAQLVKIIEQKAI